MKVLRNNDQVCHVWAQQTVDSELEGKNPSGSIFFEGPELYSYGYHYLMGKIHLDSNGKRFALINSGGYSVTTKKQTSRHVIPAVRGLMNSYSVTSPDDIEQSLTDWESDLIERTFDTFLSRLRPSGYMVELIRSDYANYNELCQRTGHGDKTLPWDSDFEAFLMEHVEEMDYRESLRHTPEAIAKREKERQKREARKEAKALEAQREAIERFFKGEIYIVRGLFPQLIRVNGHLIETSGGASVPLAHGLLGLRKLDAGHDITGMRLGHFTVDSVDLENDRIKIGCHTLRLSQVRDVLKNYQIREVKHG